MANLLVVDDETSVHQLFQSVFGRPGWEVATTVSGAEAVDAVAVFSRISPSWILSSQTHPGWTFFVKSSSSIRNRP
jgi:CheY-like chemotaxis protein